MVLCLCAHGLWGRNAVSGLQLMTCKLLFSYDLFGIENIFFTAVVFWAQMSIALTTYHFYVKEDFVKQELNAGLFLHNNWHKVNYTDEAIHTFALVPELRLTVYSQHMTSFSS